MKAEDYEALAAASKETTPPFSISGAFLGKVIDVYDGDTCRLAFIAPEPPGRSPGGPSSPFSACWGSRRGRPAVAYLSVRMKGYDAPEMRSAGPAEKAAAAGARDALRALLLGRVVACAAEARPDKYGRTLADLFAAPDKRGKTYVKIGRRSFEVPRTKDHPSNGRAAGALIHANAWMVAQGLGKPYDGGKKAGWSPAEARRLLGDGDGASLAGLVDEAGFP